MQLLTEQQVSFFNAFGFIKLPGLVRDEIDTIISEFEAVFPQTGAKHDGSKRTCIVPFVDSREKLCALLDNPKIEGAAASLIGHDFNYIGSDGNYYTGDTQWHSDGFHTVGKYIKIAFYLDKVTKDTGALRVIPTTHLISTHQNSDAVKAGSCQELWGISGKEVPSVALESEPGDVLIFNHNLMHAAFGGSSQRRMFTLNLAKRADNTDEIDDLKEYIGGNARFWIDSMYGNIMRETASSSRQIHLQQVLDNEGHLPALSAQARLSMSEPSRG